MGTRHVWGKYEIAMDISFSSPTTASVSIRGVAQNPFWCLMADSITVTADNKIKLISPTEYTFWNSASTETINLTNKYYVFGAWSTAQQDSYDQCYFGGSLNYSRSDADNFYDYRLGATNTQLCSATQAKGILSATISSISNSAYPTDGISGDYWYTYQGEDSIDPTAVSYPAELKGGNEVTIEVTPAANTYGGTITYQYEVSVDGGSTWSLVSATTAASMSYTIPKGSTSFRARAQARDNMGFTSATWVLGAEYSVINNSAPGAPWSITVPVSPLGGGETTITWTSASDADGNLSGYQLERQLDGGDWAQVYTGGELMYVDTIPKGTATAAYRVRAYDEDGAYGDYCTSLTRTVVNNSAPVITCTMSGDIGTKDDGFVVEYTVTDVDGDAVSVTEQVDSLIKRTYDCTLGQANQFEITGEYFMQILNGDHDIRITATDEAGMSTVLSLTFSKAVYAASVTLAQPLEVEEAITVAIMSIMGSIPDDANYTMEATNNANDDAPVWQDVKADVAAGRNIAFANQVQANGPAFNFRLSVSRGESGTGGYIQSIRGGFQ